MATTHSAPIDLYAESTEGFGEEQHHDGPQERTPWQARPAENGDRDEPAIDTSRAGLERVLGW